IDRQGGPQVDAVDLARHVTGGPRGQDDEVAAVQRELERPRHARGDHLEPRKAGHRRRGGGPPRAPGRRRGHREQAAERWRRSAGHRPYSVGATFWTVVAPGVPTNRRMYVTASWPLL